MVGIKIKTIKNQSCNNSIIKLSMNQSYNYIITGIFAEEVSMEDVTEFWTN